MIVYYVVNDVNETVYVGSTSKCLSDRWSSHRSNAKIGSKVPFHQAMREVGIDHFTAVAVCCVLRDELLVEEMIIQQLLSDGVALYNRQRVRSVQHPKRKRSRY